MKKRVLPLLLAVVMVVGMLSTTASAAQPDLPDWYFLFAIFKNVDADYSDVNGDSGHTVYTMTQDEIDMLRINAQELEEFLSQVGVIRPHVDVVEIDTPITELEYSNVGSDLGPEQAAPLLADAKVDLNQYDHVFCIASLNVDMSAYTGATGAPFENGTGQSFINTVNLKYWTYMVTHRNPVKLFNHEFLHFMEQMSSRWGSDFRMHLIGDKFYANDASTAAQTDIMLNRVKGDAESGTGIAPVVWQYPPHMLRTSNGWTIPSGMIKIRNWDFGYSTAFAAVTIPTSVTSIGYAAFYKTGIKDIYYEGTEAQWKAIEIGEYNDDLTKATIHYNSTSPSSQPDTTQPSSWAKADVDRAIAANILPAELRGDYGQPATRREFCLLADALYTAVKGSAAPQTATFTDTTDPAVLRMASVGVVTGVGTGAFNPNGQLNREQAATMLARLTSVLGKPLADSEPTFADSGSVSGWARAAVGQMQKSGVMGGTGNNLFSPQLVYSREQSTVTIMRLYEMLK